MAFDSAQNVVWPLPRGIRTGPRHETNQSLHPLIWVTACHLASHLGTIHKAIWTLNPKVSWWFENAALGCIILQTLWNLTGISILALPRHLSHFKAKWSFCHRIPWLRDWLRNITVRRLTAIHRIIRMLLIRSWEIKETQYLMLDSFWTWTYGGATSQIAKRSIILTCDIVTSNLNRFLTRPSVIDISP